MSAHLGNRWRVTVLGGGAWGTALAATMRRAGHDVRLWARDRDLVEAINRGENPKYLPGIDLVDGIAATADPEAALHGADCVLSVVPAQALRGVLDALGGAVPAHAPFVLCAKGIERSSGRLLSEVTAEYLTTQVIGALSGPSFATDVAKGLPTAVVVAAETELTATHLAHRFSTGTFRCYASDDVTGVEIGGALKNVFAIAAGAVTGAGLGASAQAAMVTRGFVELRRIAESFGAQPETVMGLSGLGDLMLTCSTAQSRNFSYGVAVGRGEPLDRLPLAEGVATAAIAAQVARRRGVDAPIITAVAAILDRAITVQEAVVALMNRPIKSETD